MCVVSEQGQKVLVLETGEDEHQNPLTRWGYFFPSTFYSHLYRNFFTLPEPHVNNRRLYHMSTKALGGGTAVNAMVWTWGDHRDWDEVQVPGKDMSQPHRKKEVEGIHSPCCLSCWPCKQAGPTRICCRISRSQRLTPASTPPDSEGPMAQQLSVLSNLMRYVAENQSGFDALSKLILQVLCPPLYLFQITMAAVKTASEIFNIPVESDNNAGIHESVAIVQVRAIGML